MITKNWKKRGRAPVAASLPGGVKARKLLPAGLMLFLLLTVLEFQERLPIPGKVIWITPQGAGNRKAGIGVQFADTPDGAHARTVIESHLAPMMKSNLGTHTM